MKRRLLRLPLVSRIGDKALRLSYALEDLLFEKLNRIDTGGVIERSGLTGDPDLVAHATAYHAVWCRNLRALIREAFDTGARPTTFVDVGSGKGKACLYAAKLGIFSQILGIEFSAPLVQIANENLRRSGLAGARFMCGDATQFDLPHEPSLVFMFNPFDDIILERFVRRNLHTLRIPGSLVAYANDKHRRVLARCGFDTVFRDRARQISLHVLSS